MLAGKSIISRLGIPQTNEQENLYGQQLLPQPATQLPHAVATALPLPGNLNPGTLIPVIVQPRLIASSLTALRFRQHVWGTASLTLLSLDTFFSRPKQGWGTRKKMYPPPEYM